MDANELRIGNYVNLICDGHENEPDLVKWNIQDYEFYENRMNNIKPIPLTEKWLIDLGFEPSAFTGLYYDKEGLIDVKVSWDNKFTLLYKNFEIREVESVHDLQNLYFALTKDELKINEP